MTDKFRGKFMIIDGNALVHRSFHALPPLTTKNGEMINAVYGFTAVLLKAIREFKPAYIALTLDRKEKTFRHKMFKDYKATRVKAPDELYEQIPKVKEVAQSLNIPIYEKAGFEADDLIGSLSRQVDSGLEKIIVTGDMDTLQLVNEHTKVFTMKRGLTDSMIYDQAAVKQRYGLEPEQMVDFKALRGDPSDNIPGVKGIGEKTAVELLQEFESLDGVYEYIDNSKQTTVNRQKITGQGKHKTAEKIKSRIMELLKQYKKDAFLSQELARIKCDVDMDFKLDQARFGGFNQAKAAEVFSKYEFKSLLPRLQAISADGKRQDSETNGQQEDKFQRNFNEFSYNLVDDDKKFSKFLIKLKKQKEFTFDTETTDNDPLTAALLGISFSWKAGEAYYLNFQFSIFKQNPKSKIGDDLFSYQNKKLECDNDQNDASELSSKAVATHPWLVQLKPIFEDEKIKKYGHNIKFDLEVLAGYGIWTKGIAADSMIASYLLNPGSRQHNLDSVTYSELGFSKITKDDLLGKGKEKVGFGQVALDKLYNYSCEDADFTNRLIKKLVPELKKQKLNKLFNDIEMPLVEVLAQMEIAGVKIDEDYLNDMSQEVNKKIHQLQKKIYAEAGEEFNINSTQQLREILFTKLGLSTLGISKMKTGLSTGADELAKLRDHHPIIKLIQEYRELEKLSTTYIESLPKLINPATGRLHTSYNQTVAATGRLSSTEPNLQNIPIRTELGRKIRQAFVAEPGYKFLSLDYSQIELRLAAHMSGDKKMIKAFHDGADIHTATAAAINQVAPDEVTPEMRRQAKAVNFGILYGQGPHGLSQGADIPYVRAKEFIDQYFTVYKDIKKFIDATIERAQKTGYVETLFGRRRNLPEINSSVLQVRKAAERMAVNTPLQGTAADMIKIAMIRTSRITNELDANKREPLRRAGEAGVVRMLLQVHDELLFEVKKYLVEETAEKIKKIMENVIKLKVPIVVEAKAGENWGEMTEVRTTDYH